jgi:rhamnosyltransferase
MQKVAIIVVTYNPDIDDLKNNINTYYNQSDLIVLVDNSTLSDISKEIIQIGKSFNNIKIISLGDNYGEAYAQNIGIKYVIEKGYKYFILLDQDSELVENYVNRILDSFLKIQNRGIKIGGIGPLAFNKKSKTLYYNYKKNNFHFMEVDKTLSSGFLTSVDVIKKVGLNKEELFIDYVDWEWCWRAKSLGYRIFIDTSLKLPHMLGEGHKDFIFFKLGVPSPIRHYYQYRNAILLNKFKYVPLEWKIKRMFIHSLKIIFFLFFYNKKFQRIKYAFKGIKDGLLGKSGKIK